MSKERYWLRGVSTSKKDVYKALKKTDKGLYPKAFCKITADHLTGDDKFCSIMHSDGAGSKSALAYLYWKETGDLSVWKGIAQDAIVMNIDDVLCVGADQDILLSSIIGRNKHRIPGEVLTAIIEGTEEVLDMLRENGLKVISTGGETADLGDLVKTVTVDNTVSTRMKRSNVLDNSKIAAYDVILAFSSYGQTNYETEYNSGIGSNGLTSARHDVLSKIYAEKYPETFDEQIPADLVYSGGYKLTDRIEGVPIDIGKMLLSPTRTYAPYMKVALRKYHQLIRGAVHCSGGGQTKVLNFIDDNLHVIKDQLFDVPPIFKIIQQESGTSWEEMYKVFNMGHRLELYVPGYITYDLKHVASTFGLEAKVIGRVEKSETKKLTIQSEYGTFEYTD